MTAKPIPSDLDTPALHYVKRITWTYKGAHIEYYIHFNGDVPVRNPSLNGLDKAIGAYIGFIADNAARRYGIPRDLWDDLRNELWIKAYELLVAYDPSRKLSFKTLLHTALNNKVKTMFRHRMGIGRQNYCISDFISTTDDLETVVSLNLSKISGKK